MNLDGLTIRLLFALGITIIVWGFYMVVSKRKMVKTILGIELMINGANVVMVSVDYLIYGEVTPFISVILLLSIAVAAAIVTVAIVLMLMAHKLFKTENITDLRELRW